jgi:type IV secretion system protein VirB4
LLDQSLYDNRTFLGVQIRPSAYRIAQNELLRFGRPLAEVDEDQLRQLDDMLRLLVNELRAYQPRRLGVRLQNRMTFSEIAETVVWITTGVWRPIGITTGRLGEAMFSEHIEVGWDSLKFIAPGNVHFAAMFAMQLYPAETHPFMLTQLLASSYQCTIQHSFRFVPTTAALEIIQRKNFFMTKANDPAKSQVASLQFLADEISSGRVVMGDHSCSVLVFADTEQALERTAAVAWTDLAESSAKIVRETLALKPAFLAAIPGNEHLRPRGGYVTSRNQVSFAPMFAYPPGPERGHWGPPVAVFRSPAGTPVWFHWQQDDVGNTLVTGETGSGKTTLVALLIVMTSGRAKVIALDHKRGWNLLFHAMGGRYTVLGSGLPNFAPLKSLSDTPEDLAFLVDLIRGCIVSDRGPELTPDQDRRLALGIRMVMSLPPEDRSLWEVRCFLGIDPNGAGARLEKWCHGKELGWVIDAPEDAISFTGRLCALDTTSLLNNARAREPALLYLFYRINRELDGTPTLIAVDEGWRVPFNDTFSLLVESQIRTIRSKNGVFAFITQGAKEILDAGRLARVLVEQCPTQIHLPNPRATEADYLDGLKRTRGEFETLRQLQVKSGFFLLCQGESSMVAQLPLHGMDEFIAVLSAPETALRLFDRALAETGGDVEQALPVFHALRQAETTL